MAGGLLESHREKMLPLCCCCMIKGPWQQDHQVLLFLFIWIQVLIDELVLIGCPALALALVKNIQSRVSFLKLSCPLRCLL